MPCLKFVSRLNSYYNGSNSFFGRIGQKGNGIIYMSVRKELLGGPVSGILYQLQVKFIFEGGEII